MSSKKEHTTLTPAISFKFASIESTVSGKFLLTNFFIILSVDFNLVFIVSIGFLSYSRENSSFNTLNFVSTSIIAHL